MQEYLEKLLSQIRCAKARPYIFEEIKGHIESQIDDNVLSGMSREEAEARAVADMGDPVETGISLDRIHRPKIAWRLLILIGILSLAGLCLQMSILYETLNYEFNPQLYYLYHHSIKTYVVSVVIGFICMLAVYFLDYTLIAGWAKVVGLLIIAVGIFSLSDIGTIHIYGTYFIALGSYHINVLMVMMFYVPVYGGILYKYRNGDIKAFIKAMIWLCVPVIISFKLPSLVTAAILFICMLTQLTLAVWKGWFKIPVKRTMAIMLSVSTLLPALGLYTMYHFHLLETYQIERIRSFFSASGDGFYITSLLRKLYKDALWIGHSSRDAIRSLPDFNGDYVLAYIISSYGRAAGMIVIVSLAVFVIFIFSAVFRQKNELGLVMSFGCGMIILLNTVINLLGTLGIAPLASSFLPFFSAGGSMVFLNYILLGMVMSIYRYKEVYPKQLKVSQVTLRNKSVV